MSDRSDASNRGPGLHSAPHLRDARAPTLTVLILTRDELLHIKRCIESARNVSDEILVVDSGSTDGTAELAASLGARVVQHGWINHASQLNWALENLDINSDWIMRLDADEILDPILTATLPAQLATAPPEVSALEFDRHIRFLGREIRHGGMSPMWVVRVWRNGRAHCEARWMDEHMVVDPGTTVRARGAILDDNLNTLTWWTDKHNRYASREALDLLLLESDVAGRRARNAPRGLNRQARAKRWLKTSVYSRLPLGSRAWLYYAYRILIRGGILDGPQGLAFHTLQGLWYRLLVDYKIFEVRRRVVDDGERWPDAVRHVLGIDVPADGTDTAGGEHGPR